MSFLKWDISYYNFQISKFPNFLASLEPSEDLATLDPHSSLAGVSSSSCTSLDVAETPEFAIFTTVPSSLTYITCRTLRTLVGGTLVSVEFTYILSAILRDVLVEACSASELKIASMFPIFRESGEGDSTWHVNRHVYPHPRDPSSVPQQWLIGFWVGSWTKADQSDIWDLDTELRNLRWERLVDSATRMLEVADEQRSWTASSESQRDSCAVSARTALLAAGFLCSHSVHSVAFIGCLLWLQVPFTCL